ncbi:MAG: copper resistance protein B [Pseudomonadota bacterium]
MRVPQCVCLAALLIVAPAIAQEHQHDAPADQNADAPGGHGGQTSADDEIPDAPVPSPPNEFAADHVFAPSAMAAARAQLRREHGGGRVSSVFLRMAEYQGGNDDGGYRWDAEGWFGSDIHRLVLKSEGEGARSDGVERAELQALYSRAVGVYTDIQLGVRQDFEPSRRSYITAGVQTLFPYWFHAEGALFLSDAGEILGRIEGSYDGRITNRWILQPRVELNLAAKDSPELHTGSGLSIAEIGLRLRYEIKREFAPYVGISWEKQFGRTGDYARLAGGDDQVTSFVFGIRAFF